MALVNFNYSENSPFVSAYLIPNIAAVPHFVIIYFGDLSPIAIVRGNSELSDGLDIS